MFYVSVHKGRGVVCVQGGVVMFRRSKSRGGAAAGGNGVESPSVSVSSPSGKQKSAGKNATSARGSGNEDVVAMQLATNANIAGVAIERIGMFMELLSPAMGAMLNALSSGFETYARPYVDTLLLDGASERALDKRTAAILDMILGIALLLVSREYILCIAAVEAFRLGGWETNFKAALKQLYQDYLRCSEALCDDNAADEDNDGVADVHQLSSQELTLRRTRLLMRTIDPIKTQAAMFGLYTGLLSVIATLCVSYGYVLTLGCSTGDTIYAMLESSCGESIAKHFNRFTASLSSSPSSTTTKKQKKTKNIKMKGGDDGDGDEDAIDFDKWVRPALQYVCRSMCVSALFFFRRIAATFHASIKGAKKVVGASLKLRAMRIAANASESGGIIQGSVSADGMLLPPIASPLILVVGCIGFYHQVLGGFAVLGWIVFPLKLAISPLQTVEWLLMRFVVASMK